MSPVGSSKIAISWLQSESDNAIDFFVKFNVLRNSKLVVTLVQRLVVIKENPGPIKVKVNNGVNAFNKSE